MTGYRWKYFMVILVFTLSACSGSSLQPRRAITVPPSPTVVLIGKPMRNLPAAFLGFNVELSYVCSLLNQDAASPEIYEHLYSDIGPGILHIGGRSADLGTWAASGPFVCSASRSVVTPELISMLFAFARRIHWQVIWTLPLLHYNPANAADEAGTVARLGGISLASFAIGNEPELFSPYIASWNTSLYLSRWETEEQAVLNVVPQATFSGPDTCCETPFFPIFTQKEGANHHVSLLTHHYYAYDGIGHPHILIPSLLSLSVFNQFVNWVGEWEKASLEDGLPFALTEVNSISDGGIPGVSNTAGATLWLASLLLDAAAQGVSLVAIQEAQYAIYNVIVDNGQPSVLYVALQLVHQVLTDSQLVTVSGVPSSFQVIAVRHTDETMQVVVINHNAQQTLPISIAAPDGMRIEEYSTLSSPYLATTNNVQLLTHLWTGTMPAQVHSDSLMIFNMVVAKKSL